MDEARFLNIHGRESMANVLSKTPIGDGGFSRVYEVEVEIGGHKKKFAIKEYKGLTDSDKRAHAKKAFDGYKLCQNAGLRVFPTFRLGSKGRIIMTLGRIGKFLVIGNDNRTIIDRASNFKELMRDVFEEADRAADGGVMLYADAYFMIVEECDGLGQRLDFVLGDFDNVRRSNEDKIHRDNRSQAEYFLELAIKNNFAENIREESLRSLALYFHELETRSQDDL